MFGTESQATQNLSRVNDVEQDTLNSCILLGFVNIFFVVVVLFVLDWFLYSFGQFYNC